MFGQVLSSLIERTKDVEGVNVEDNKFCVSVHYRNVDEKVWPFTLQPRLDIYYSVTCIVHLIRKKGFCTYLLYSWLLI
jgi:hypothetical protein